MKSLRILAFTELELLLLIVGFLLIAFLSISFITIGFNLILYVFCFLLLAVIIFKEPKLGLFLAFLGTIIFERYFTLIPLEINEVVIKIYPLDITLILTFIALIIHDPQIIRKTKLNLGLISVLVFLVVLGFGVARTYITGQGSLYLAIALFKTYAYALIIILVLWQIKDKGDLAKWLQFFIGAGILLLFFVFWGLIAGQGLWSEWTPGLRYLAGTHAFYLLLTFFITLVFYLFDLLPWDKRITAVILALQIIGLISSMFRHIWLSLALGLGLIWLLLPLRNKWLLTKLILTTIVILIFTLGLSFWLKVNFDTELGGQFVQNILDRFDYLSFISSSPTEEAAAWRVTVWQAAGQEFLKHPFFGVGLGQSLTYQFSGFETEIDIRELHNDFISLALQLGLLGFLSLAFITVIYLVNLWHLWQKRISKRLPIIISLLAIFFPLMIGLNFGVYLTTNLTAIFFWLFFALTLAAVKVLKPV